MVLNMSRPRHLFRSLMIRCFSNDDDSTTATTTVLLLLHVHVLVHVRVRVRVRVRAKGLSPSLYSIEQKTKLFTKPEISRGYPVLTEPVKTLCPPPWDFKETIIKRIRFGLALTPVKCSKLYQEHLFSNYLLTKIKDKNIPGGNDVMETSFRSSSSS